MRALQKLLHNCLVGIFYGGTYVWELDESSGVPTDQIKKIHDGDFWDHLFVPGISVKVNGNRFKITRWGIARLPMSGNSFVHILLGTVEKVGSKTVIRAHFRLNLLVFAFTAFWLTFAYLISGVFLYGSAKAVLLNGDHSKVGSLFFSIGFPVIGTLMLLAFRRLAKPNEVEILSALKDKFGEPIISPGGA